MCWTVYAYFEIVTKARKGKKKSEYQLAHGYRLCQRIDGEIDLGRPKHVCLVVRR